MKEIKCWKGLKKELDAARKNRGISSKVIILECECSPAYFYKVISGDRKPGKGLIKKLAKSLEISEDYINELISLEKVTSNKYKYIKTHYKLIIFIVVILIILVFFINVYLTDYTEIKISSSPTKLTPRIVGDSSSFIKDVTIPDGSYILINKSFKKIWRIKNTGKVLWKNRYLMRVTPFEDLICHSDFLVPIKETLPGEEVDIEVNFTSMPLPGSCRTDWKMVDRFKEPFFLNKQGLYSIVHITDDKTLIITKDN